MASGFTPPPGDPGAEDGIPPGEAPPPPPILAIRAGNNIADRGELDTYLVPFLVPTLVGSSRKPIWSLGLISGLFMIAGPGSALPGSAFKRETKAVFLKVLPSLSTITFSFANGYTPLPHRYGRRAAWAPCHRLIPRRQNPWPIHHCCAR